MTLRSSWIDQGFIESLEAELGDRAAKIGEEWFSTPGFSERLAAAADWQALRQGYEAER